jgi:hypothetical protein
MVLASRRNHRTSLKAAGCCLRSVKRFVNKRVIKPAESLATVLAAAFCALENNESLRTHQRDSGDFTLGIAESMAKRARFIWPRKNLKRALTLLSLSSGVIPPGDIAVLTWYAQSLVARWWLSM